MSQFIIRAGRALAAATVFGALISTVPLQASQAQTVAQAQGTAPAPMKVHAKPSADRMELRIKQLHDQLHITAAQETLWAPVAQAMRDSGTAMRASMVDRSTRLKTMTAVDDLKSYEVIADKHAEGLKQLIPAFETLYVSMTPAQQKNADHVFGEHQRKHS